jgi:hypothetical protein
LSVAYLDCTRNVSTLLRKADQPNFDNWLNPAKPKTVIRVTFNYTLLLILLIFEALTEIRAEADTLSYHQKLNVQSLKNHSLN